jgi:hypothetical protein
VHLDRATLNRTLLARQHLLARAPLSACEMLEHLVGVQSQVPTSGYVGLWSRIAAFAPKDLAELLLQRRAVRLVLQRSTIHLVTGADALAIRPVMQPLLVKDPYARSVDATAVADVARAFVDAEPRSQTDLVAHLRDAFPGADEMGLWHAARAHLALVQVPPRGVWSVGGAVRLTTAEAWLDAPLGTDDTPDALVVRYLRAFGPASMKDFGAWTRLTGLRPAFDRLRPSLRTYTDEHGVELFDVPDGELVDGDTTAPVRFLPEYDNVLLAHADRSRIVSERAKGFLSRENGYWPFVLADGAVCATWSAVGGRVRVVLFDDADVDAVVAEGERLATFLELDDTTVSVERT